MTSENLKTRPGSDPYKLDAEKAEISQRSQSGSLPELAETCANEHRTCMSGGSFLTQPRSLDVPELRRHLKAHSLFAAPVLRPHLLTLEQQLKSWDEEGNRDHLRKTIARTVLAIENLRQPSGEPA